MKSSLIEAVRERFEPLLTNTVATAATTLDPRYKLTFFPTDAVRDATLLHLKLLDNNLPRTLLSNHK